MAMEHKIVNVMVDDLLSCLGAAACVDDAAEKAERALAGINAYMFEHDPGTQACFVVRADGTLGVGVMLAGPEGARRLNTLLLHAADAAWFASPVDHNPARIEVVKNRFGVVGLYESRDRLAREAGVSFTMRMP